MPAGAACVQIGLLEVAQHKPLTRQRRDQIDLVPGGIGLGMERMGAAAQRTGA
jgi:hypothetical protein